jgi:hypothetical protein
MVDARMYRVAGSQQNFALRSMFFELFSELTQQAVD